VPYQLCRHTAEGPQPQRQAWHGHERHVTHASGETLAAKTGLAGRLLSRQEGQRRSSHPQGQRSISPPGCVKNFTYIGMCSSRVYAQPMPCAQVTTNSPYVTALRSRLLWYLQSNNAHCFEMKGCLSQCQCQETMWHNNSLIDCQAGFAGLLQLSWHMLCRTRRKTDPACHRR
jgi:hypothetical protein